MRVKTTIITGTLGSGKTSLICKLIQAKPPDEKWAIIVNEFGSLGIDGALLEGNAGAGVSVRQLAGGCLCCQAAGMLTPAIAQILRATKPHRLIIEPSGLGHPVGLMQVLQSEHLGPSIDLQAIVCLVDVRTAAAHPSAPVRDAIAEDQISVADVLVGSKSDLATQSELTAFEQWSSELWPPKTKVLVCGLSDTLDVTELLDTPRAPVYTPLTRGGVAVSARRRQQQQQRHKDQPPQPLRSQQDASSSQDDTQSHNRNSAQQQQHGTLSSVSQNPTQQAYRHTIEDANGAADNVPAEPQPRQPARYRNGSSAHHDAVGWLFHPGDVFREGELRTVLTGLVQTPELVRLKGVFRVGPKRWVAINYVPVPKTEGSKDADIDLVASAYTKDSRLELITSKEKASELCAHNDMEGQLLECIV